MNKKLSNMNKALFLAAAAVATLTACSKDKPIGPKIGEVDGIAFSVVVDGTRATVADKTSLTAFPVYAFDASNGAKAFDDVFTFDNATSRYFPATAHKWELAEYDFYSYFPQNAAAFNEADKKITGFSPAEKVSDQVDLIVAGMRADKATYERKAIPLQFHHCLSLIKINAQAANYVARVKAMRIVGAKSKGTFDFSQVNNIASAWSLDPNAYAVYEVRYQTEKTLPLVREQNPIDLMATAGDNPMLLPQTVAKWDNMTDRAHNKDNGAAISLLVNIRKNDGTVVFPHPNKSGADMSGAYAWVSIPIDGNWEAGQIYSYTLTCKHFGYQEGVPTDINDPDYNADIKDYDPSDPGAYAIPDPEPDSDPLEFKVTVSKWTIGETFDIPM